MVCHVAASVLAAVAPLSAGAAEVGVGSVIAICERALAGGYEGMDAATCDWYVRPCGVCGVAKSTDWCVPPEVSAPALAREVVAALKAAEPAAPAKPMIEEILRAHHPCAAQDGRHDQLVDP